MKFTAPCQASLAGRLTYDDAEHAYTLDGARVPSVTAIISAVMNGWKKVTYPPGTGERGRAVHLACELDDLNDLDEASLDPTLIGYLSAWRSFREDYKPRWIGIEARVASTFYQYAGTFDRLAEIDGFRTIIDIKSGRRDTAHGLQTAAYALAYQEETGVLGLHRWCVYVTSDGDYSVVEHERDSDLEAFLACRTLYRWKEGK